MTPTKTLRQREQELQSLLVTPAGQKELQHLDSQYQAKSGRLRAGKASVITYILVHERAVGLIRR
jgi:hypothetical protein